MLSSSCHTTQSRSWKPKARVSIWAGSVIDLDQAFAEIGAGKAVIRAWFFQRLATALSKQSR